ncbi:nickel transporter [Zoogloea sp.]|uniref:HoxN/HupN/NixA family nickel/cobalt transporter n=1 Tax=Zoogloea sp. TaxID=49181 RepID=UPI002617C6BD|nr:nickel transporter [Zoogloea sp.]MDD3354905.1 nickel transporter [Zoogloea sp.]
MPNLPTDSLALALLVFVLGLKHGFDADHLATIDGLTRYNMRTRPRLARWCGSLFSLGHGAVVVGVALAVSLLSRHWEAPAWLELSGAWISILFLLTLGVLNIRAAYTTPAHEVVRPLGLRGRWLGRLNRAAHPLSIALVGALFALSFDTVSQATLFAMAGVQAGSWVHAVGLGLTFMLGMLVADGANGLWIARLIARSDDLARIASRIMALAVAGMSLLVAAWGLARLFLPELEAWGEGKELVLGLGVIGVIFLSFVLGVWLARGRDAAVGRVSA